MTRRATTCTHVDEFWTRDNRHSGHGVDVYSKLAYKDHPVTLSVAHQTFRVNQ